MDILKSCLEEISLSGLEGCTVEELWNHLANRQPPISFKLDDYIKQLAWKHLLKCAEKSTSIQLFKLPAPRERKQVTYSSSIGSLLQWMEYKHPFSYCPVSFALTKERGSCCSFSTRENVTAEVTGKQMDLAAVLESYGDSLVLVASQELRERALSPPTQIPPMDISDIQYGLLEVIGCSRHYGVSRPDITTNYLKIDARSVYHHNKSLRKLGLVVVKMEHRYVTSSRSQLSHVMYLTCFAPATASSSDVPSFEQYFCSLLENAPNKTLSLRSLREKLGDKKVKGTKAILMKKGHIRAVVLGDVAEEFANDPDLAKVKGVQLIKPYRESEAGDAGEGSDGGEDEDEEAVVESDRVPVVTELPLITQGYKVIDSYGPQGMANMDFCFRRGLSLDPYVNRLITKSLIKQCKVSAITLDNPPIRTVMLVTDRHLQANSEYLRLHEEKAKSGNKKIEVAVVTGEKYLREKKVKKEIVVDEEAGPSGVKAAPVINVTNDDNEDEQLPLPRQQVEGHDDEVAQALQNKLIKTEEVDRQSNPSEGEWSLPGSSIGTLVPESELSSSHLVSQSPNPDSKVMTYHQLRRCNLIVEYMEQHRVVQGYGDIAKHVRDVEKCRGTNITIHHRTVIKLLERLVQDERLLRRDDVLEAHLEEDSIVKSQPVTFWCLPTVSEEEIKEVKEKAVESFYCVTQRRSLHSKPKTKKEKKKKTSSSDEEEEEGEETGDEAHSDATDVEFTPNVTTSAKFQRLRHLHYYLWILIYGRGPGDTFVKSEEEEEEEEDEEKMETEGPPSKQRKSVFSSLPESSFPWAKVVQRLPLSPKGEGWVQFSQLHHHLPLSLWLILIKVYKGIDRGKLSSKYRGYFEDDELKNKLLHQLPRKLRKSIIYASRDIYHICDFLKQLDDMGLVDVEGDYSAKPKSNMYVYLKRSVTLLDTSTAEPRYSFFLNEARELFRTISFNFVSLGDVEKYWFQLQTICLKTPIILREHPVKKDSDLAKEDNFPLLYSARMYLSKKSKDSKYNSQGFGAAGLPPLTFSHISRNWRIVPQSKKHQVGFDGAQEMGPSTSLLAGVGGASYMPGEGLYQLPNISMEVGGDFDDGEVRGHGHLAAGYEVDELEQEVKCLPPSKRAKLMAGVSVVPSGQVRRNEGGKGRERFRQKKPAALKKTKAPEAATSSRYRLSHTISSLIVDAPDYQPPDRDTVTSGIPERAHWFPKEDSFLLLTYLTAAVMVELGQPIITYSKIQEAYAREFPSSKYKTVGSVKRRLQSLIKKKVEVAANLDIFVSETIHEINTLADESLEYSFESILAFVCKKYHSQDGSISLPQVVLLPATLEQLYNKYEVVGGLESKPSYLVPADTVHEVNQALLTNLIIATVGSNESLFDQYKAFKLFETFPEADIEEALAALRRHYLIKLKRTTVGVRRRQGPNTTVSYNLSANFFSRLEHYQLLSHLKDIDEFKEVFSTQLAANRPSCSDDHVTSDPAVSLVNNDLIRIEGEWARNGTTAAVIDTIVSGKNLVSCLSEFPEPLFEPGNEDSLGAMNGEMSEGEEEEEGGVSREDDSQSARQFIKTALKEAERGANSDEEDAMEFEEEEEGSHPTEEGAAASQSLSAAAKYRGIGALFNFGAGVLRYSHVDLVPGFSIGKLLEPIPDPERANVIDSASQEGVLLSTDSSRTKQSSIEHSTVESSNGSDGGKMLTLEDYLVLVERELGFSSDDVEFARQLYNLIEAGERWGVERELLCTHTSLRSLAHQMSLEDHIQTLLNFEMIHRMGINKEHLVSYSNSNYWSMTPDDVTKRAAPFISYRPWSLVGSCDPNSSMLTAFCHGVLSYIMACPGVTQDTLRVHFSGLLQPNGLQEVLNVLELSGHIKRYSIEQRTVSCFNTTQSSSSPSNTVNYYEPVL